MGVAMGCQGKIYSIPPDGAAVAHAAPAALSAAAAILYVFKCV